MQSECYISIACLQPHCPKGSSWRCLSERLLHFSLGDHNQNGQAGVWGECFIFGWFWLYIALYEALRMPCWSCQLHLGKSSLLVNLVLDLERHDLHAQMQFSVALRALNFHDAWFYREVSRCPVCRWMTYRAFPMAILPRSQHQIPNLCAVKTQPSSDGIIQFSQGENVGQSSSNCQITNPKRRLETISTSLPTASTSCEEI